MADLNAKEYENFEDIKRRDENNAEYWLARELASVLEYAKWENFSKVIDHAILACKNGGFELADNFIEISKTVKMPTKPRKGDSQDHQLSWWLEGAPPGLVANFEPIGSLK
jgi:DNA-damage-inducible protein D